MKKKYYAILNTKGELALGEHEDFGAVTGSLELAQLGLNEGEVILELNSGRIIGPSHENPSYSSL